MTLRVLYFASLKDRAGLSEETVDVSPSTDVTGLWSRLTERHPGLAGTPVRPMVACDMVYSAWDRPLDGVTEVAFLPPVSGG